MAIRTDEEKEEEEAEVTTAPRGKNEVAAVIMSKAGPEHFVLTPRGSDDEEDLSVPENQRRQTAEQQQSQQRDQQQLPVGALGREDAGNKAGVMYSAQATDAGAGEASPWGYEVYQLATPGIDEPDTEEEDEEDDTSSSLMNSSALDSTPEDRRSPVKLRGTVELLPPTPEDATAVAARGSIRNRRLSLPPRPQSGSGLQAVADVQKRTRRLSLSSGDRTSLGILSTPKRGTGQDLSPTLAKKLLQRLDERKEEKVSRAAVAEAGA